MKTAEEILDTFEGSKEYPQLLTRNEAEEAMKIYAKQIVVQSLIDSAISYDVAYEKRTGMTLPIECYQLLISTKIQLP